MDQSPRPKLRPKLKLSYDDLKKIERVVNEEAKGEGVEGRNAIRGVIFNRLMSDRFPDTVDEVLSPREFEPVGKYGSIDNIPVDQDTLNERLTEMADYIQYGEDASKGSTFFLNKKLAKKRKTDFGGKDGMTIGNHTFYKSYEGQEPVEDVNFSHNIEVYYPEGYAKGGVAMDEQMDAVFKSSRAEKDPVSGNDVPPGSLPEEVRDDIPAQLSEGEYVVPADVLRFYGMKFFEDLRKQAKIELAQMDRDGRIGGEPIAVMEISELSPEEMEELEAIGAAVGGYITQQPTQSTQADPYQQQQMMYRQGSPVAMGNTGYAYGGAVKGYAPGGLEDGEPVTNAPVNVTEETPDFTQPTFTAPDLLSQFGAGFSFTQPSQTTPTEYTTVTLYGPEGDIITLTLPTQQKLYEEKIKEGYTTEQVAVTTETEVGKDDGAPTPKRGLKEPEIDVDNIPKDELLKTAQGLSTMNKIATAIATSAGLPVAAFVNAKGVAKYNDILDRLAKEDPEAFEKSGLKKKGSIFGGESSLYENLEDTDGKKGPSFGDTWLGDLLGFDEDGFGVQGDSLSQSLRGSRRDGSTTAATTPSSNNDNGPSPSPTPTVIPTGATIATGTVLNNPDDPVVSTIDDSGNEVLQNESSLTAGQQAAMDWDE